ncbi:hypothetical protein KIN_20020 [Litoreibacter roseus]|uniref:HTH cro/C1-type domain-containing protein n=2 Tax=Litoreibacter roseus TaxID=2601869 RepID=A0A6N6JI15_9RHOB|nr:hypothetical protein KIN_20020 [Litoreibacter roseus]
MAAVARKAGVKPHSITSTECSSATVATMNKVVGALGCRVTWGDYPNGEALGAAIRQVRQQRGRTQLSLVECTGVTTRTLIALENQTKGRMTVLEAVMKELKLKPKVVPKNRRLVPTKNASEQDVVYTPRDLAAEVISHFKPTGVMLEPFRGNGQFLDAFPARAISHYCEIDEGRDFFDWHQPIDWIVSNPPWSQFRAFNIHAMRLAANIVWVIPLVHFSGKARMRDVQEMGFGFREIALLDTPKDWPQGGFQLAAFHLKRGYSGPTRTCVLGERRSNQSVSAVVS